MRLSVVVAAFACCIASAANPYYLHISDTHLDLKYTEGAPCNCYVPLLPCCHSYDLGTGKAPKYGHTHCDAPAGLVEGMLAEAARLYPAPDFILFTGDACDHNALMSTTAVIHDAWAFHFERFQKYFPGVRVYPTLGNHDVYPMDLLSASGSSPQLLEMADLWEKYGVFARDPAAKFTMAKYGYYALPHTKGVRVVSLDSMFALPANLLLNKTDPDPGFMNAWFEDQLVQAEKNAERVILIGHVAPIPGMATDLFVKNWNAIVARHPGVIAKAAFGHTHKDQFALTRPALGAQAIVMNSLAPGGSPFNGIWPGIRVVEYRKATMTDIDWHQYHVNVTKANEEGAVTLELFYSAKKAYGLKDVTLNSTEQLVERMRTDEMTASIYNRLFTTSGSEQLHPCDMSCRKNLYCNTAYTSPALVEACKAQL